MIPKKLFKHLEPGDSIWQVIEIKPGIWKILEKPVTDVQWPYQRLTGDYCYMEMSADIPTGIGHSCTYTDDPSQVAINGPFGFVLSADTDQERDFYVNKEDAIKARLRHLRDALDDLDKKRKEIQYEIEECNGCCDELELGSILYEGLGL
jgi:hypothetical protein